MCATQFFKSTDWLKNLTIQSECSVIIVAQIYAKNSLQ